MHDDAPPARPLGTSSQVGVSVRRRSSEPASEEVRAREPERLRAAGRIRDPSDVWGGLPRWVVRCVRVCR